MLESVRDLLESMKSQRISILRPPMDSAHSLEHDTIAQIDGNARLSKIEDVAIKK